MACSIREGRAWKFGDNISTDFMMPSFTRGSTAEKRARFCMRANRPEFAAAVRPGDVVVGGKNFGCGSSRPVATNLITLGVSCVIAKSFSIVQKSWHLDLLNHTKVFLEVQGLSGGGA